MGEIENFEEIRKSLEKMKTTSKYFKDLGKDFIDLANDIDNMIDLSTNPFRIMLSKDIVEEMNRMNIMVNLKSAIISGKMNALGEYMGNKKEGEDNVN